MEKLLPYYMTNENWYYFDEEKGVDVIKDDAPREAIISFKAFNEYSEREYLTDEQHDKYYEMIYQPQLQEQNKFEENKGIFGL